MKEEMNQQPWSVNHKIEPSAEAPQSSPLRAKVQVFCPTGQVKLGLLGRRENPVGFWV